MPMKRTTQLLKGQIEGLGDRRPEPMRYRFFGVWRFATGFRVLNLATRSQQFFYGAEATARWIRRRRP